MRQATTASLLIGLVAVAACSDDDSKQSPKGDQDAGADASVGGNGGSAGSSGGTGAVGGTGATGAVGGTGATGAVGGTGATGAVGGSGGTTAGTGGTGGVPELTCDSAGAGGSAGSAGSGGGGPVTQWRDWAGNICRDCPTIDYDCATFNDSATLDVATGQFTIQIQAGVTDVISATYQVSYTALDTAGAYIYGDISGDLTVNKNTLSADLSASLPPDVVEFDHPSVAVTDACGLTRDITYDNYVSLPDTGTLLTINCEL